MLSGTLCAYCVLFACAYLQAADANQRTPAEQAAAQPLPITVEQYRQELADLHVLRDYRAGKNAFVLNQESQCNKPLEIRAGQRKTILDLRGRGSLRHIWATHGPRESPYYLEMFMDGEQTPSIKGKLVDLLNAARKCRPPLVLNPGGIAPVDSLNLYLPIPFEKSIRVDLVATYSFRLVFLQLDYRLDDDSLKGVRLTQSGAGEAMQLAYQGSVPQRAPQKILARQRHRFELRGNNTIKLDGPAVIRMFKTNTVRPNAHLKIRFDGEPSAAVDVRLADFFGPFAGAAFNNNACYLPMPFAKSAEIEILRSRPDEVWNIEIEIDSEQLDRFEKNWGYFHAKWYQHEKTSGYDPITVLYTRGKGHWIGQSLYATGHDHGGGDFAVLDGETDQPAFLHGINGEDYFSFAFFGQGRNFPYSEAFDNERGRLRVHLENPYPFTRSLHISWATVPNIQPRSVTFWYQDSPADLTLPPEQYRGLKWQVFGQCQVPLRPDGITPDTGDPQKLFAALPAEQDLDAGREIVIERYFRTLLKGRFKGWAEQYAAGPYLNLMYIYRHSDMGGDTHIGHEARCMQARATLASLTRQRVNFQLSYDDPLAVYLDDREIFSDMQHCAGFVTRTFAAELRQGNNKLLIKMLDTPNVNKCWAVVSLRILDQQGNEITAQLQPKSAPR